LALSIIRQIEDEGVRGRSSEIIVKCPVSVANFIVNQKRDHIANIEARFSLFVRINADTALVSPEYSIEKLKTSSRLQDEKHATPVSSTTVGVIDVGVTDENDNDEPLSPSSNAYADDDDGKPKKRRRRRRRKSKQGVEDQEVAVNGIENTEEPDVTLAEDPKDTFEMKNSISSDQEAKDKKLSDDDDANTAVPKRKRSPRKKTVVSKDNNQSSEASDTKEPSTAPELRDNDEGVDTLKAKSKPRTRKKVTKEETGTKDTSGVLDSNSISEGEEALKKSDKKVTKVSKSKSSGTKKASTQSVTVESMDEDMKKPIIEDKVNTLEVEKIKKTRRSGWWSKKS
jgi:ribonuclease E